MGSMESILQRLTRKTKDVLVHEGVPALLSKGLVKLRHLAAYPVFKKTRAGRTFTFAGKPYTYFTHHYNSTWRNERAVEVALAAKFLSGLQNTRMLEVGNVLNNYLDLAHVVVDKYEKSPGVLNHDILDFGAPNSFDVIVSISTLEHVGWDETPRDPDKVRRALAHLRELLTSTGTAFYTVPLGYNSHFDRLLFNGELDIGETRFLKRVSRDNRWEEVDRQRVEGIAYGSPYPYANALLVGIDRRPGSR